MARSPSRSTRLTPKNPTGNRFTNERFEKALNVTLNSVVFRSYARTTTTGTYIEMASRVTEPLLLGLAVLAVEPRQTLTQGFHGQRPTERRSHWAPKQPVRPEARHSSHSPARPTSDVGGPVIGILEFPHPSLRGWTDLLAQLPHLPPR